jgi:hypothetical protein
LTHHGLGTDERSTTRCGGCRVLYRKPSIAITTSLCSGPHARTVGTNAASHICPPLSIQQITMSGRRRFARKIRDSAHGIKEWFKRHLSHSRSRTPATSGPAAGPSRAATSPPPSSPPTPDSTGISLFGCVHPPSAPLLRPVSPQASAQRITPSNQTQQQKTQKTADRNTRIEALAAFQALLNVAEKALDTLPVWGPKAAVGATAEIVKLMRVSVLHLYPCGDQSFNFLDHS